MERIGPSSSMHHNKTSKSSKLSSNLVPTKEARVFLNRLTDKVLRQHGSSAILSSSPAEQQPLKKRQRVNSLSDFEKRALKSADRINGTSKVTELFGDDSDEEPSLPMAETVIQKKPTYNYDALNYENDSDNEDDAGSSRPKSDSNAETLQVNKEKKSSETVDCREKFSKSEKRDKNSGKDNRKEKDKRKKESEKTSGKKAKSSREKDEKESNKSQIEKEKPSGNPVKYRIPKRTAASSTTVGLPPLLQDNLNQVMKINSSSVVEENVLTCNRELKTANENSLTCTNVNNPSPTSNDPDNVDLIVPSDSPKLCTNEARPILRITRDSSKGANSKSVYFAEKLASIRSISPRTKEAERQVEISSVPETYLKDVVYQELDYVPESSPRPPVTGIRPLYCLKKLKLLSSTFFVLY